MARKAVLMLCHRLPYPADKGDKIRNLNIIRALQQVADVHLGCFIDTPFDLQYQAALAAEVTELFCLYRSPLRGACHAALALCTGRAITEAWYADSQLQQWTTQRLVQMDAVLVSSSAMVQYCMATSMPVGRVLDLVDVDSDKWSQYAIQTPWYLRWLYQREARLVAAIESQSNQLFDQLVLVSTAEAAHFCQLHPHVDASRVHGISNGVDTEFYTPSEGSIVADRVLFTGDMSYKPNVEAVLWFVSEIWPLIIRQQPQARFVVVGRNPTAAIRALASHNGIEVTGRVDDIRPWLDSAALVVAPMLMARGIKNKVLEALAMAKPLVVTPQAMLGLPPMPATVSLQVAETAAEFAAACVQQLQQPAVRISANREYVRSKFSWQHCLAPLFSLLKLAPTGQQQ